MERKGNQGVSGLVAFTGLGDTIYSVFQVIWITQEEAFRSWEYLYIIKCRAGLYG